MNLVCNPKGIIGSQRPKIGIRRILDAGFCNSVLSGRILCDPYEFQNVKRKNFKREEEIYLSEHPEMLRALAEKRLIIPAKEQGLEYPIAEAPYASVELKDEEVDNDVLKQLAKETIRLVGDYNRALGDNDGNSKKELCHNIIVHPLTLGIDRKDEWEVNKTFYLELAALADELDSNIQILLINKAKNINGHLIRGVCAEPEEAIAWVDELNNEVSHKNADIAKAGNNKRFGLAFDIGTATLCGLDLYEAIAPLGDRLKAVIIRDVDGIHDVSMLPYSACMKGAQTGWLYLIRALRKACFDGDLIMDATSTIGGFPDPLKPSIIKLLKETGDFLSWHIGMEKMVKSTTKRVLFGAGNMCRAYMKDYGEEYPPLFTCDNNSSRWGEEFCGLKIENPEKLKELSEDVTIILCNIYYSEIEDQIKEMGLKNRIEWFSDEYMATFHMDRLKMAGDPIQQKDRK